MVWGPEEKTIDQLFFEFASRFEEIARRETLVQIDPQVGLLIVCSGSLNRFEKSRVKRITSSRKWNTVRVNLEIGEDIRCLSIAEKREQLCVLLETGFSRLEKWLTRYLGVQEDSFLGRIVPFALDDFRKNCPHVTMFHGVRRDYSDTFPNAEYFFVFKKLSGARRFGKVAESQYDLLAVVSNERSGGFWVTIRRQDFRYIDLPDLKRLEMVALQSGGEYDGWSADASLP